jgi:Major capsid protein Gp23
MSDKILTEAAIRKWKPVLDHADMPAITDPTRRAVVAQLLENQEVDSRRQNLMETAPNSVAGSNGGIGSFDPILIQLVRRAMPNLMAYDICGVQAMNAPTGLIFALRSKYGGTAGTESSFDEPSTVYSGTTSGAHGGAGLESDPFSDANAAFVGMSYNGGMSTLIAEDAAPQQMAFNIEKVEVSAKTRTLAASYSIELAQDLKAVHGLDAESELSNILSTEILAEINREVVRTVYNTAVLGCQQSDLFYKTAGSTATGLCQGAAPGGLAGGIYDLVQDSDGRWSAEKFRGLMFQIERECNVIAKQTRRGKGNFIICSADVASALAMGGFLNLSPALNVSLDVDDTGNTFVGTLNGKIKVYVDPYAVTTKNFCCVGYKGSSAYDAGIFYCPYVPLQMMRAVDQSNFQPKIAFKTRYGMVANPYAQGTTLGGASLTQRTNKYYRLFRVDNLHGVAS